MRCALWLWHALNARLWQLPEWNMFLLIEIVGRGLGYHLLGSQTLLRRVVDHLTRVVLEAHWGDQWLTGCYGHGDDVGRKIRWRLGPLVRDVGGCAGKGKRFLLH